MPEEIAAVEDLKLQFARQLYERALERHGEDHEKTRLLSKYIAYLENLNPMQLQPLCVAASA